MTPESVCAFTLVPRTAKGIHDNLQTLFVRMFVPRKRNSPVLLKSITTHRRISKHSFSNAEVCALHLKTSRIESCSALMLLVLSVGPSEVWTGKYMKTCYGGILLHLSSSIITLLSDVIRYSLAVRHGMGINGFANYWICHSASQTASLAVTTNVTTFLSTQWPANKNKYHKYLLAGKGGRCVGVTTLPSS